MAWVIAVVVVDDASRSVLLDGSGEHAGLAAISGSEPAAAPGHAAFVPARLPTVRLPDGEPSTDLTFDLVERLLGRPIGPLWLAYNEEDDALVNGVGAVMTMADPARDAASGRVFLPVEMIVDRLEPEHVRGHVRAWLDRLDGDVDPATPPWLDPGWHPRASAWIVERMASAGRVPTGPTRMTYQSVIGTVLRTPSAEGDVYLKCPAPVFRTEATITRALASRTPGWVPDVIDVEPQEGWLLMADLGPRQLGGEPEATWPDGIRRLGEIQRAWVGHTDELIAAGGWERPISDLAAAAPRLLDAWPEAVPRLLDACRELEDIGLPTALVHGDCHPWNIAVTARGPVVFDWSDSAAGPSFLDLAVFLRRTNDLALRRVLRDAYVDAWSGVAPRARLERATELAMSLGALYQVVTYRTLGAGILPADRATFDGADVNWLRNTVDALDTGLDSLNQRT